MLETINYLKSLTVEDVAGFTIIFMFFTMLVFVAIRIKQNWLNLKGMADYEPTPVLFQEKVNELQVNMAEKEKLVLSRYAEKKQKDCKKDLNRYGRWSCTLHRKDSSGNNIVQTRVGTLRSAVNAEVKSYRELK